MNFFSYYQENMDTPMMLRRHRIEYLPKEIFRELREYLIPIEFCKLLCTNNHEFKDIRYECRKLYLREEKVVGKIFEHSIVEKIKSWSYQLHLLLSVLKKPDAKVLQDVLDRTFFHVSFNATNLSGVGDWAMKLGSHFHSLYLFSNSNITSFEGLISDKLDKMRLDGFKVLTDVSQLAGLRELTIENCPMLVNVSSLGNIHRLSIINCSNVQYVSSLKRVPYLHLERLTAVVDTNELTDNISLTVLKCPHPSIDPKFPAPYNIQMLTTDMVTNHLSFSSLKLYSKLKSVTLSNYADEEPEFPSTVRSITFIDAVAPLDKPWSLMKFNQLEKVSFSGRFPFPSDLSPLKYVSVLEFFGCSQLTDISSLSILPQDLLTKVRRHSYSSGEGPHELSAVPSYGDIHPLTTRRMKLLRLDRCNKLKILGTSLYHIARVIIIGSDFITDSSCFRHINHLTLNQLHGLTSLRQLRNVKRLEIYSCHSLTEVDGIDDLIEMIDIRKCPLKKLHGLGQLKQSRIILDYKYLTLMESEEKRCIISGMKHPLLHDYQREYSTRTGETANFYFFRK
jgi:hypothetical protein